jgi:hypothetical protein
MSYNCSICNKSFTTNGGLKRHNNKKVPCLVINPIKISKFKCGSCNRCFTSNQTLKNHVLKTCLIIKNKKKEENIINTMQNEIIELKNAMDELRKNINGTVAINSNNTTNNNTTNNTQNITINITPFSQTKLTEKCIIDLFLDESTSACEYSKLELMDKANQKKERTKNLIKSLFLESFEKSFSDDITDIA